MVNKFQPTINQRRARGGNRPKGSIYRQTISYCENEIRPLLDLLHDESTPTIIKKSLRKFLVISLISTFEFYFKNMARRFVDNNIVDLTKIFKDEICFKLSELETMLTDKVITKGNIVISSVNFDDLNRINNFFSKLLDIDLFNYLYAENTKDKCRMMIKDGPPIDIKYKNLLEVFELRNKVVHELSDVPYSYRHIVNLWDNAMNIFDIANTLFISPELPKRFRLEYGIKTRIQYVRSETRTPF